LMLIVLNLTKVLSLSRLLLGSQLLQKHM